MGDQTVTGAADDAAGPHGLSLSPGEGEPTRTPATPDPCAPSIEDLLRFERETPRHPSLKAKACRDTFGISLTRYWRLVLRAIRDPQAWREDPLTVLDLYRQVELARERRRVVGHVRDVRPAHHPCGWCEGTGLLGNQECPRCRGGGEL